MTEKKKRILIVEDDKFLLEILGDSFEHEGFEVLRAVNGKEGLRVALAERPDLILLDLVMPEMDGISMLRELRHHPDGKDLKVIILTNLSDSVKVEEALKEGVHDYLVKTNWLPEDLIKKVREKLAITSPA